MSNLPARLRDLDVALAFDETELERRFDLEELAVDRANAAKRRAAADTLRAWQSDWAKWLSFCNSGCLVFPEYERLRPDHLRRRPIPADPRLVRDFIAHHAEPLLQKNGELDRGDKTPKSNRSLKRATLARIVSTISKAHDLYGVDNPCTDSIVRDTLATYSRRRREQRYANPVTWDDISKFLSIDIPPEAHLPNTPANREAKVDLEPELKTEGHWLRARSLLTMAYTSMVRREELIRIDMEHIENEDVVAELFVPYTKGGESDHRHVSAIALQCYRDWIRFAGIEEGPVFCQFQRGGDVRLRQKIKRYSRKHQKDMWVYPKTRTLLPHGKRMNAAEVNRVFKACMRAIGKPGDFVAGVSGHSCRRGANQDLEDNGASLPEQMTAGGWKSPTMPARYSRGRSTRRGAMAKLAAEQKAKIEDD